MFFKLTTEVPHNDSNILLKFQVRDVTRSVTRAQTANTERAWWKGVASIFFHENLHTC